MRLKSLEIKGFKSFADKTHVNFDENITGIVGPNGCGKSNIVDSIRWVIGEQKISQLRSENLESLVFNGSKTRSASGLAEVSLTFENNKNLLPTEFTTVTITRKFFKNGESEYRLNDVQCRLKDIQNLFMDTGISTDSYAIIELGMVDDLIKDKENSRRRMLEQAAGISIYKTRKKEAKQKLDATEQDLARIDDLLFEINNQLKSLENQSKKAQKYFEIKKEYRELSIELAKAALDGFNLKLKELTDKQEQETGKRIELENVLAEAEGVLEKEKKVFEEKEGVLHTMQNTFNELVQQLRTKEAEKSLATQRLEHLKEKEGNLVSFLNKASGQIAGIEESIVFTQQQTEEEGSILTELSAQLEELKASVSVKKAVVEESRATVNNLRASYQQLQRTQFDAEKKVAVADTSIQNIQRSLQQIEDERENRQEQIQQLEEEKESKDKQLAEKMTALELLREHHQQTKEQIEEAGKEFEGLRSKLADENRKLDAKRNEYDLLKSLIDKMEGYPESVKFLHNNKDWNHTAPILSDIIYVKENYRAAVENVLEPYLNYYVVNNLEEGFQAIHLLDINKKGKANFFLLDKVNNTGAGSGNVVPEGTLAAMDVIEVEDRYLHLAQQLLGNVYIAEGPDFLHQQIDGILLEKEGKLVKGEYTLSGGSVGLFEGKKIGRVKNLEKLHSEIETIRSVVDDFKHRMEEKQAEIKEYQSNLKEHIIKESERELQQLNNGLFSLQNKLENFQHVQAQSRRKIEDLNDQLTANGASIVNLRSDFAQLTEQLNEYASKLKSTEAEFRDIEVQYNEVALQYNTVNLQVTRQQSKLTALKQEHQFKTNQLTDLNVQVQQNTQQISETTESITQSEENLLDIQDTLYELVQRKQSEEQLLMEADKAYYALRNLLSTKEAELRQKTKEKEIVEHLLSEIKDKLNEVRLNLAGMKERLNVEFKIVLEEILKEERTGNAPVEELQEKADKMKKRLENLGEVNPTAIEAFEEMKKRYDFIVEQKGDLVTAKQSLLQTIAEVESTANKKFLDTFNQVRENFQNVFKALFTEDDQCDLVSRKCR